MNDQLSMTVKRCLTQYRFFNSSAPLVVAVSTGVDSMVLLTALQTFLPPEQIVVAHVNHHLRTQSQAEEAFMRDYCRQHQLQLFVDQWEKHPTHGIELAARKERYRFFKRVLKAVGSHYLLTAHHENDLAETMLMKIIRTGDVNEVLGMKTARPLGNATVLHPLLRITKAELVDYAQRHDVRWFEDQTNQENGTLRNRVRHRYLPEWQKENPQVLEHLLNLHDQLGELLSFRDSLVEQQLSKMVEGNQLQLTLYRTVVVSLRRWVLRAWLNQGGVYNLSRTVLSHLDRFLCNEQHPVAKTNLGSGFQLVKNYQTAMIKKVQNFSPKDGTTQNFMVKFDHWYTSSKGRQFGVFSQPTGTVVAELWLLAGQFPLQIRPVQPGDRLRLKSGHYQSVRRILINQKVPLTQRDRQLVMVDHQGEVLWVIGHKTAWLDRTQLRDQRYEQRYFCQKINTGENDE